MSSKLFLMCYKEDLRFVWAPSKGMAQVLGYGSASGRRISLFEFVIVPTETQLRAGIEQLLNYHKRTGWGITIDQTDLDQFVANILTAIANNKELHHDQ